MRSCVIHVGTHKTATTAIQVAAAARRDALLAEGWLYPRAGRPAEAPDGHHNIAWELTGDRRFTAGQGTVRELLAEVDASPAHVVLSSEDFECGLRPADPFRDLVTALQQRGLEVTLLVYLRHQVDYLPSLYLTMLKFGIPDAFEAFVDNALETGTYHWQEWTFTFDYADLASRLESLGARVLVRSYDAPPAGSVVADFFETLGVSGAALDIDVGARTNPRPPLPTALSQFYRNRLGQRFAALADLAGSLAPPVPLGLDERTRRAIVEGFRASNSRVAARYGLLALTSPPAAPPPSSSWLALSDVFADERVQALSAAGERLLAAIDATRASVDALRDERDSLAAALERADAAAASQRHERERIASERDAVKREHDRLLQSRSWRLTAPLRKLRSLLRRPRR